MPSKWSYLSEANSWLLDVFMARLPLDGSASGWFATVIDAPLQDEDSGGSGDAYLAISGAMCMVAALSMKAELLENIREELRGRLQRLAKAAWDAHAAATDPGSKAEGKYDTRSLEASYLAAGQSRQVDDLAEAVRTFDAFSPVDFSMDDPISMGALVEADMGGETSLLLLVPAAGGMVIPMDGQDVTLLTPASSLYQNLLGRKVGDFLESIELLVIEVS